MRFSLILFLIAIGSLHSSSQNSILYDLDTYKRVVLDYRITTFSPDVLITYNKKLNTVGQEKNYGISIGGHTVIVI